MESQRTQDRPFGILALACMALLALSFFLVAILSLGGAGIIFGIVGLIIDDPSDDSSLSEVLGGTVGGALFYVGNALYLRALFVLGPLYRTPEEFTRKHYRVFLLPVAAWAASWALIPPFPAPLVCAVPYLLALAGFALLARRQRHQNSPKPTS